MASPKRDFMLSKDDPSAPTDVPVGDGDFKEFGEEPSSPPPDPSKPYIWLDGEWWLLATDTADGVPDDLGLGTKALTDEPASEEESDNGGDNAGLD